MKSVRDLADLCTGLEYGLAAVDRGDQSCHSYPANHVKLEQVVFPEDPTISLKGTETQKPVIVVSIN